MSPGDGCEYSKGLLLNIKKPVTLYRPSLAKKKRESFTSKILHQQNSPFQQKISTQGKEVTQKVTDSSPTKDEVTQSDRFLSDKGRSDSKGDRFLSDKGRSDSKLQDSKADKARQDSKQRKDKIPHQLIKRTRLSPYKMEASSSIQEQSGNRAERELEKTERKNKSRKIQQYSTL